MISKAAKSNSRIERQIEIYRLLDSVSEIFPKFYTKIETNASNLLIIGLCGPNLEAISSQMSNKPFGERFLSAIAIQLILAARFLNICSILHCDIKPSSIVSKDLRITSDLLHTDAFIRIKLVGFDLAFIKPKIQPQTLENDQAEFGTYQSMNSFNLSKLYGSSFPGCRKFASPDALESMTFSTADDCISILYTCMSLALPRSDTFALPWTGEEDLETLVKLKRGLSLRRTLCNVDYRFFNALKHFKKEIRKLNEGTEIGYLRCSKYFEDAFQQYSQRPKVSIKRSSKRFIQFSLKSNSKQRKY